MRILRHNIIYFSMIIVLLLPMLGVGGLHREQISLGVPEGLAAPLSAICEKFSHKTKFDCKITSTTIGHLYSHVMDGIGYDLVILSDETYTQGLIHADKADAEHHLIFANGRLVLWGHHPIAPISLRSLIQSSHLLIGIPNPSVSSYGGAAKEVLQSINLWDRLQNRLVFSFSSQHTYEMIRKEEVPLGFVPLAMLSAGERQEHGYWEPDPKMYKPIQHEAIMIKNQRHPEGALALLAFLKSDESCQILRDEGFNC